MTRLITLLRKQCYAAVAIIMLIGVSPAPVFADGVSPAGDTAAASQPVSTPNNGPTGSDAHMFHYDGNDGLWKNNYYTYDPATQLQTPVVPLEYTCNPSTDKWDAAVWEYVASDDVYEQSTIHLANPPAGAITHPCPAPDPVQNLNPASTDSQPSSDGTGTPNLPLNSPASSAGDTSNTSADQTNTNGVTLNTNLNSTAVSGNALASNNDDVVAVGSGNASVSANVFNLLQSQAAFAGAGVNTFTANIQGNVQGDFLIDPSTLTQPASVNPNDLSNAKITNVTNGTINNNIVLNAVSGNATADNNDDVGTIKTGDATAIADVINMINSVVAANQSFVGTINIYGDYTGNILMPVDSLNALLSTAGSGPNSASDTTVNNTANYNVANNVNLGATSGAATASNNDDVGSVTTGSAMTNLTILNLTGKQVVAANSLLVFVNVLGNWVGLIMNAPAGTTSAALGGGVSNNAALASTSGITNTENYGINNNITANATTGNAAATNNDDVGAVASGNAVAGVSLANLINSNFSLSNWFGVLFINVFGTWHGNFGVMTPPVVPPITSGSALPSSSAGDIFKNAKVFAFIPVGSSSPAQSSSNLKITPVTISGTSTTGVSGGSGGSSTPFSTAAAILGSSHTNFKPSADLRQAAATGFNYWTLILMTIGTAGLGFVAVERVRNSLRSRYSNRLS